jgi:hypothetical protein
LPRVASGSYDGSFENVSEGLKLRVTHANGKRVRRTVRLDFSDIVTDPFLDGTNRPVSMSTYLVVDTPLLGISATEISYVVQALVDWLDTPANLAKVLGGES